jgi:hypothetical protein
MRLTTFLTFCMLTACGGGSSAPKAPEKPACELSVESLPGRTFVMLEAKGDKTEVENPQARVKFEKEGGKLVARYTVKSLDHVYPYECEKSRENEVMCLAEPNIPAMCIALEVHKAGACTKDAIRKLGVAAEDKAIDDAMKEAKAAIAKAKEAPTWPQFKTMYNNVGNALQGVLYAKVDTERCRLSVDDMFKTVYNGKAMEDFNPVGTNAFVESKEEFLFEDCDVARVLAGWKDESLPEDLSQIAPVGEFEGGKPVHLFYVGDAEVKPTEGCTYSMDTWANWKPGEKGKAAEVKDEKIMWHTSYTHSGDKLPLGGGKDGIVYHMKRTKTCGGKAEKIDTVCALAILK